MLLFLSLRNFASLFRFFLLSSSSIKPFMKKDRKSNITSTVFDDLHSKDNTNIGIF